jgi:preprotein translocase subunit SecE
MSARLEMTTALADLLKWIVAIALFVAALAAFYLFPDESLLLRVVGLLVAAGLACAIVYTTAKGREGWHFLRDARTEVRKVVWPTRTETLQTTGIVIVVVSLLAVIMWGFDSLLSVAVKSLLGSG